MRPPLRAAVRLRRGSRCVRRGLEERIDGIAREIRRRSRAHLAAEEAAAGGEDDEVAELLEEVHLRWGSGGACEEGLRARRFPPVVGPRRQAGGTRRGGAARAGRGGPRPRGGSRGGLCGVGRSARPTSPLSGHLSKNCSASRTIICTYVFRREVLRDSAKKRNCEGRRSDDDVKIARVGWGWIGESRAPNGGVLCNICYGRSLKRRRPCLRGARSIARSTTAAPAQRGSWRRRRRRRPCRRWGR